VVEELERCRVQAARVAGGAAFGLGGAEFRVQAGAFGRWRYWLSHPAYGQVGLTALEGLPTVRVQPLAAFIHAEGVGAALDAARGWLAPVCEGLDLWASRLDLFADVVGWELSGDDRDRFRGRFRGLHTYEDGGRFTGFTFGKRGNAVHARIYDKTVEAELKGNAYWRDIWRGGGWDGESRVLRVEFEFLREGLKQFGRRTPEEALEGVGDLWCYATSKWLTYRCRTGDSNKRRWPLAREWTAVQRPAFADHALGLERVTKALRGADRRLLVAQLCGYLASLGASYGEESLDEVLKLARWAALEHCAKTGEAFPDRVRRKAAERAAGA
jgi:hypothetical protein